MTRSRTAADRERLGLDAAGAWVRGVRWLWCQDDARRDEDTTDRAWTRLFGGEFGTPDWVAELDQGDRVASADALGRVWRNGCERDELGVVPGSPADRPLRLIISGGQTGADRGGLDAALARGVPIGGWAPHGWRAEDGEIPERYRAGMREAPSSGYEARTSANVQDSDGTLIVSFAQAHRLSGGSARTRREAYDRNRPCLHLPLYGADPGYAEQAETVVSWARDQEIGVLNVAGPRESKEPGIGEATRRLIDVVIAILTADEESAGDGEEDLEPFEDGDGEDPRLFDNDGDDADRVEWSPELEIGRGGQVEWSPSQVEAIDDVARWMRDPSDQIYRLFGAAGTGKSTLVQRLVEGSGQRWLYAAFTGKAALVMRQKGCVGAQTIHSLIYRPSGEARPRSEGDPPGRDAPSFNLWADSPLRFASGVVIDECSMVDEDMGRDLLSFGKKILVCGDPAQLPPVAGGGFFTDGSPDFVLTEIHRQARGSGILDLATFIRHGGEIHDRVGWTSDAGDCDVISRDQVSPVDLMRRMVDADQVIVGVNKTRQAFNDRYRRLMGVSSPYPQRGDRVICLRNEKTTGLLNGSMWRVEDAALSSSKSFVDLELVTEDGTYPGHVTTRSWAHHFVGREADLDSMGPSRMSFQEFAYAYNITCHKAQGSQWDHVVVFDESRVFRGENSRRWLYTAITRAAKRLTVIA